MTVYHFLSYSHIHLKYIKMLPVSHAFQVSGIDSSQSRNGNKELWFYLPFFTIPSISHILIVNDERDDLKQKESSSFDLSQSPGSPLLYSP